MKALVASILSIFIILGFSHTDVSAADFYVATNGSDSNPGTSTQPFKTIQKGINSAFPGDTVYVKGGRYYDMGTSWNQVQFVRSGEPENPITLKAYQNEAPVIDGSQVGSTANGMSIEGKQHIIIDGIDIYNSNGSWIYLKNSNHITIKNCDFRKVRINVHALYLDSGSYLKVQDCYMDETYTHSVSQDRNLILVEKIHYSLFENLTLRRGQHSLIDLQNSTFNIIRNNDLYNDWQKGSGISEPAIDVPGRNVFENNRLYGSNAAIAPGFTGKGAMGLYLNQRNNIIRKNIFYDNENFGILVDGNNGLGNSSVTNNRIYHNTLFNNGYKEGYGDSSAGITVTTFWVGGIEVSNNVFKNNIISNNRRMAVYVNNNGTGISGNAFQGNCIYHPTNANGAIKIEPEGTARSLSYWQSNASTRDFIKNNVEGDPLFVSSNLTSPDFNLNAGSPCIDSGVALTTTRSQGSGTTIPVSDASYFMSGYGIEGVQGDLIEVGSEEVRVVNVDYVNNNLTVDRSISWNSNVPVNLPYYGNAPDSGALESEMTESLSKLLPVSVEASSHDGNLPENTLDGNSSTRWSACGVGETITYDLGSTKTVSHVNIAFYLSASQIAKFDIEVSDDKSNWTQVFSGQSSTSTNLQKFDFTDTNARYVRIVGNGNLTASDSCWNSYTELEIYGSDMTFLTGDANGDGQVNGVDYVIWLNNFGKNTSEGRTSGDFNNDGVVSGVDYVLWLNSYLSK